MQRDTRGLHTAAMCYEPLATRYFIEKHCRDSKAIYVAKVFWCKSRTGKVVTGTTGSFRAFFRGRRDTGGC